MVKDILLATSDGFGRSTVSNWGSTDHGNATEHHNQTKVGGTHDSVAVACRIVKRPNAGDGMGTYERLGRILYSRSERRKNLEGVKTR